WVEVAAVEPAGVPAVPGQLFLTVPRHIRRDREAYPFAPSRTRIDHRVDADHFTVHIQQGAAGIARIDRSVSLNVVVVSSAELTPRRRDDSDGHRLFEAERRAEGDHSSPLLQLR